jgi:hypothetical protein
LDEITDLEKPIREMVADKLSDLCEKMESNEDLTEDDREAIADAARKVIQEK